MIGRFLHLDVGIVVIPAEAGIQSCPWEFRGPAGLACRSGCSFRLPRGGDPAAALDSGFRRNDDDGHHSSFVTRHSSLITHPTQRLMSNHSGTLATRLTAALPSRATHRVVGVVAFAVLTALGAKLAVPLPVTLVPFTFQVLFVLLAGALLGPRLGASSQVLYLGAGAVGFPVFAGGGGLLYLLGPTGGYLLAFPLAAFVVGWVMAGTRSLARAALALCLGLAAIYAGGISWLTAWGSLDTALVMGLRPFLLADLIKVGLALLVVRRYRDRLLAAVGA
jgi:biotin transport system substrate-specific component